ncbi:MAG: EscU/YscU/HrcU family type III secretion system export apparatus switch protein, partial [Betaproteobacteria bacterium]|nr:EscU/YscU/HrcU family type III secretion system export apparatus switch protein [Betaproteobacteria bacterium]
EGQFPQSPDVTTLVLVSIGALAIWVAGGRFLQALVDSTKMALSFSEPSRVEAFLFEWLMGPVGTLIVWISLVLLVLWFGSVLGPFALVNFQPKLANFKIDPERISFINGLKRIFSLQGLSQLGLALLKATLIFSAIAIYLWVVIDGVSAFTGMSLTQAILYALRLIGGGMLVLIAVVLVLGVSGGFITSLLFKEKMKMSVQELKDELKESEGNPELKARIRQKQREMARSRMIAAVEKADVVVMNPTHIAVALRYEAEKMAAPVVVAKGHDNFALRIREVAKEHQVPVTESPVLARALDAAVKVGAAIPEPLYRAVAALIAWAYEVKAEPARAPELYLPEDVIPSEYRPETKSQSPGIGSSA